MHYVACYIVRMLMRETVAELNVRVRQALSEDPSTNGAHLLALFADFCDLPVEDAKDASEQGDALVLRYGNNLRENSVGRFEIDLVRHMVAKASSDDDPQIYRAHMTFSWRSTAITETFDDDEAWLYDDGTEEFWELLLERVGWQWFYEGPVFNFDCDLWLETPASVESPTSYTYRVDAMAEPPEVEA